MPANIKQNADGRVAMIYNEQGGRPWWGGGTPVTGPMTVEVAKSVFPFHYYKEKLFRVDGSEITTHVAIVISDTRKIMNIGGATCSIYQPEDCAKFIEALSDEGMTCETAGALGDGEKIWFLCHAPDHRWEPVKGDEHRTYTLVTNSYDFSSALEGRNTDIRVVCQNTLDAATSGNPAVVKIKHTANMHQRASLAAEIYKGYVRASKTFREAMIYLAKHPITDTLVREFEIEMFGDLTKTEEGTSQAILKKKLEKFEQLMVTGHGTEIKGVVGTVYGLLNAFGEYQDWHSIVRNAKNAAGQVDRTNSILFGQAAKLKSKALELALVLAKR
jgi:phage/plasmid-like protein (TIGR03299 family)